MKLSEHQKARFRELLEQAFYKKIPSEGRDKAVSEFEAILLRIKFVSGLREILSDAKINRLSIEFKGNSLDKKKRKKKDVPAHKAWAVINKTYLALKHNYHCQTCGGSRILSIHHKTYSEGKRLEHYNQFMYLCKECHMEEHRNMTLLKKQAKAQANKKPKKQLAEKKEKIPKSQKQKKVKDKMPENIDKEFQSYKEIIKSQIEYGIIDPDKYDLVLKNWLRNRGYG